MSRSITWLGHATVLLELRGTRLLTDPVVRPRLGHLTRRAGAPPDPGRLDAILISHAHRDHLDLPTLRRFPGAPVIGPRGVARLVGGDVVELAPGEETRVGDVRVRATDAVHEVRRARARIPALGFVVDEDVYFAGDTDLFPGMADLAPLELALLPVWGWGPNLGPGHMDPARAAEALALLRARRAVPIHWGTYFPLGLRGTRLLHEPPREFARRAASEVVVLEPGGTLELVTSSVETRGGACDPA